MREIIINHLLLVGKYAVIFQDENGMSILTRTKTKEHAKTLADVFAKQLKEGRLLKPHKSAYE